MFNEVMSQKITSILEEMVNPVKILFFRDDSDRSLEAEEFLRAFTKFSSKISLVEKHEKKDLYPAIFITNEDESIDGVGFYGTPAGYEINSFLSALLEVSGKGEPIIIKNLSEDVELYAFVSLTCDKCPKIVTGIHRLAIHNSHISAYMLEESLVEDLIKKNHITEFPTILYKDKKFYDVDELVKELSK